jgi:hypothetical protein
MSAYTHIIYKYRTTYLGETSKEALLAKVGVMFLGHFFRGPYHLQAHQLVAALFEARDDVANDSTLNSIGLDGQERAFLVGSGLSVNRQDFFALGKRDRAYGSGERKSRNGGKADSRGCRSDCNSLVLVLVCIICRRRAVTVMLAFGFAHAENKWIKSKQPSR